MPRWDQDEPYQGRRIAERPAARTVERQGERPAREGAREHGRGPKGYRRSDDRILDEVCERFARSGVDAGEVEVAVKDGVVTLGGRVARREDRRRLEAIAEDVLGVSEVNDATRIGAPPEETAGAGTGTTGTGLVMSARQAGAPVPQQAPRRRR
jgi:hypothetical protein